MLSSSHPNHLPSAAAIEQQIGLLFTRSPQSIAAEQELDSQIDAIVHSFLQQRNASSALPLDVLTHHFSDSQIPLEPLAAEDYLRELGEQVVEHSTHTASPQFMGHMTTALPYFVRPLAKLMAALNQNVVKTETAKALTPYERQALSRLHRLIYRGSDRFYAEHSQNPHSTLGIVCSGGTIANITALWCARNRALPPREGFAGIAAAGLAAGLQAHGYRSAVVVGSSLMHFSFDKAADLLGIGAQGLIKLPATRHNQIDVQQLRQVVQDCRDRHQCILAIVGIAGTTDSGAIDPLLEIAQIAEAANVHFHVDAAWGGPVLFSQTHRHKLAGIEFADSVTIDGHKQLYLPLGLGMLFFRRPDLAAAIEKQAPYTVRKDSIDLGKRALEGSRSGAALLLQAGLQLIGIQGYEWLIDRGIGNAHYMATRIAAMPDFELLTPPQINLLLYRYIPHPYRARAAAQQLTPAENHWLNHFNQQLQKTQRQAGNTFISRTTIHTSDYGPETPIVALRAVLANPLTAEADIDRVLAEQTAIGAELLKTAHPL